MSTANKNPFTSFVNAYCGLVANQVSDMSMQFDKVVTQSNALFNELAERGEAVEAEIKQAIPRNLNMNKSIKNWFDAFSFGSAKTDKQLDELSKKVDGLIDAVAILAEQKAKAAAKPAAKRATKPRATKAAASKATDAKPAGKATAAKKPATRKTAAKPAAKSTTTRKPATRKPRASKPADKE